jgi:hypothetical protein
MLFSQLCNVYIKIVPTNVGPQQVMQGIKQKPEKLDKPLTYK